MTNSLADYILKLRLERDWSLRDVSRRTGIPHSTLANIESGNVEAPRFDIIVALAKLYKVEIVKFATAFSGQDPDIITDDNKAEANAILDSIIEAALQRRESPESV
jgi:transcriptional regulator with XRE-family HTH domain